MTPSEFDPGGNKRMKSSVVGTLSLAALLIVSPGSTLGGAALAGELSG